MFDFLGVAILVVLILVFGLLAYRAGKAKRRWLRWVGRIFAGLLTIIPLLLLILALIGFSRINQHFDNPVANVKVAGTPEQIARGERIANMCTNCHTTKDALPLSGANFIARFGFPPIGTFYAPNLTPGGNIADWSDGEVIRAIREGTHKDGRSLLIMPSDSFRNMSDDDVQALVAYLRSQPATGGPTPDNKYNIIGALFVMMSDIRTHQPPVGSVTAPKPGTAEYGKYLVDTFGCRNCHGTELQGRVDTGQPGPPAGPNLTKMVPQWSEDQFMNFFNTGKVPGGGKVPLEKLADGSQVPRMPWTQVRAVMTDDDLKAIYLYLHGLAVVDTPTK